MAHREVAWSCILMALLSAYSCSSCLSSENAIFDRMGSYCKEYYGTCDEATGHYVYLSLSKCFQNSTIPDEIGLLTELKDLTIDNYTVGLPSAIGNLSKLQSLVLWNSKPYVNIPDFIRNLVSLTSLHISESNFTGTLPSFLFELPRLATLRLYSNLLEGSLPKTLPSNSSLNDIVLSDNDLSGPVPSWLFSMEYAVLAGNRFTSPGDAFPMQKFSDGMHLDLSDNLIEDIPDSLFLSGNFTYLILDGNRLSGTFDLSKIKHMTGLQTLGLSWNRGLSLLENENTFLPSLESFTMDHCDLRYFPHFLSLSENLSLLSLSNNKIRGSIDFSKGWNSLRDFNASLNLLEGSLTAPPPKLESLSLSENRLSGQIPAGFCNLKVLNLSFNGFDGVLDWKSADCSISKMEYMNLGNNNLSGSVTAWFPWLTMLFLNGNKFTALSRSLLNSSKLEALDVGNNNITQVFPEWLGDLPKLHVLVLSYNNFYGDVAGSKPRNPFPFENIVVLDASHNRFTGLLPLQYVPNFKYRTTWYHRYRYSYYEVFITYKGSRIPIRDAFLAEEENFTSLDFSFNQFSGNIPPSIANLERIMSLNLNNNKLSGEIPSSLGELKKMRSLDLSSNFLVGGIPKELMTVKRLQYLNLSYNQLYGPIPVGKSFSNESYAGNIGLCGIPLVVAC